MTTPSMSFNHGVASGDPYSDSVILWTRITTPEGLNEAVDVSWEASLNPDFDPLSIVDSGTMTTSAARDWTVKVEADGLTADTIYYYRFRVDGAESMVGQTKTLPVGSDPVRLAVFSCANYTAAEQFAAYGRAADLHAVNPYDALLHLGDYIYEYGPGGYGGAEDAAADRGFLPNREILSLDDYRQRYALYHTDENLQALRATAPLIAIWDDHETANDSWAGGAENHQSDTEGSWSERRDAALKAYYEWLPIREPSLREGADQGNANTPLSQGYRSFNFGDVLALHILETRLTARDEQLAYPDAEAVQVRIGEILADQSLVNAYAETLGITAPADASGIPAFAAALAPAVTQELVLATVQQAWGDPNRDLIGDTQMAWLQQQMASSDAAWQVLGQQVLMQSMAVPAELLLNPGDPTLLDKYAAPLQKLATGTVFADLSPSEQALFNEATKIPYNLDAWDGYGVERETILQTALALGKRLLSLAGDTHNAWAGLLDTMSAGTQPAGTVAGVEFATPGVTAPGFEKYLPGADAYIRARYPAVDGLDGLFLGYVNGLKYSDLNRRGFLDLTVSKEQAVGTFQLLNGADPLNGKPLWSSETVVSNAKFALSTSTEARPLISWQPEWRELDLVFGLSVGATGSEVLLNPAEFASLPRAGVHLADVTVLGSGKSDRIFAGIGSLIDASGGSDELFNIDSQGDNVLIGGIGSDSFFLRAANDWVIGGQLLPGGLALIDDEPNQYLIDSSASPLIPASSLHLLDVVPERDQVLLDGQLLTGQWTDVRSTLSKLGIIANAAPSISGSLLVKLLPGSNTESPLPIATDIATDADGDPLEIVLLESPEWIRINDNKLRLDVPQDLNAEQLAALRLKIGISDGKAVTPIDLRLEQSEQPDLSITLPKSFSIAENTTFASDPPVVTGGSGTIRFQLGGDDANLFTVDTSLGVVRMVPRDFEAPADKNGDNEYELILKASDTAGSHAEHNITLQITDAIEQTSLSISGLPSLFTLFESQQLAAGRPQLNGTPVGPVGTVAWSINGPDSEQFSVDTLTGALNMQAQDFEDPRDNDANNIYRANLVATDSDENSTAIEINVQIKSLNQAITPATDSQPVLDFRGLPQDQALNGLLKVISRTQKGVTSSIGFYKTQDSTGAVLDQEGGLVSPGDPLYGELALSRYNAVVELRQPDKITISNDAITGIREFSLRETGIAAPYALLTNIIVDPTSAPAPAAVTGKDSLKTLTISPSHPVTPTLLATVSGGREVRAAVFGVSAANPDGQPYFKALGDGKIGMTANISDNSATFSDLLIHFDAKSLS